MSHTDLPYELAPYSDGVDGGYVGWELVGCELDALTSGHTFESFTVNGGLHSLAVAGLPQVMISGKARRRLARNLVGALRSVTPSIGWTGATVGRCPKARVAGWSTP